MFSSFNKDSLLSIRCHEVLINKNYPLMSKDGKKRERNVFAK